MARLTQRGYRVGTVQHRRNQVRAFRRARTRRFRRRVRRQQRRVARPLRRIKKDFRTPKKRRRY